MTQVGVPQVATDTHVSRRDLTHQQPSYTTRKEMEELYYRVGDTTLYI